MAFLDMVAEVYRGRLPPVQTRAYPGVSDDGQAKGSAHPRALFGFLSYRWALLSLTAWRRKVVDLAGVSQSERVIGSLSRATTCHV